MGMLSQLKKSVIFSIDAFIHQLVKEAPPLYASSVSFHSGLKCEFASGKLFCLCSVSFSFFNKRFKRCSSRHQEYFWLNKS